MKTQPSWFFYSTVPPPPRPPRPPGVQLKGPSGAVFVHLTGALVRLRVTLGHGAPGVRGGGVLPRLRALRLGRPVVGRPPRGISGPRGPGVAAAAVAGLLWRTRTQELMCCRRRGRSQQERTGF